MSLPTEEHLVGVLKHVFDPNHLHMYGEAFGQVAHPVAEGLSHSASTIHEHLSHVDVHSFDLPHDVVPHFHFPFITLALSTTREIRLLSDEKTTIGDSLKNAGLDVAGTGLGGFGGAKLGAAIGTAITPGFGTIIGGAIGGLIGGLGGRFLTDKVKTVRLREVKEVYDGKILSMNSETTTAARILYDGTSRSLYRSQQSYLKAIGSTQSIPEAVSPLGGCAKAIADMIREEFRRCREELALYYQSSLALIPRDSWYNHLTGGAGAHDAMEQLRSAFDEKDRELQLGESRIPSDALCNSGPLSAIGQLVVLQCPGSDKYESALAESAQRIKTIKASYLSNLLIWARRSAQQYQEAMGTAQTSIAADAKQFQVLCERWMEQVRAAAVDVNVELAKHGRA